MFIKRVEFHEDGALKALELYHSPGMTNEEFLALVDALATRVMSAIDESTEAKRKRIEDNLRTPPRFYDSGDGNTYYSFPVPGGTIFATNSGTTAFVPDNDTQPIVTETEKEFSSELRAEHTVGKWNKLDITGEVYNSTAEADKEFSSK